ncbi:hypothetical protein XOC_3242 [Xanthomonas oryzae pv. oryzicola BLS256]|uniref:Uncharacterized protein n=1 Tax=Xanthomonas oryzae pv. oryzicola (strain BLS256) TaxID=383407 RepID=G7TB36_XANOB|nr:hypothetical protein XOC_3242 [Xanthomonas oryzae pv. oryzicola BLS256]QEO96539.1 hypothetical protein XOCgx_1546 [Xanthomonas oryzae pv. oryzicola]
MLFGEARTPVRTLFRCSGFGTQRCLAKKKMQKSVDSKKKRD